MAVYDDNVQYAVFAITHKDLNRSVLTSTPFIHKEDALAFAKKLSVYTGFAIVDNMYTDKRVAKLENGVKVNKFKQ